MKRRQYIKGSQTGYQVGINISMTKEGDVFVASCQALDLTSFGDTFQEAQVNMREAIHLFLEECQEMGTLDKVLRECGWHKSVRKDKKEMVPPHVVATLSESICIPA